MLPRPVAKRTIGPPALACATVGESAANTAATMAIVPLRAVQNVDERGGSRR